MHQVNETLSPGALIRGRYLVIDLLGKGGFSAVYLIQDQQQRGSYFALKVVTTLDKQARELFTFECTLLKRLVHPALPQVHDVFDDEDHNRMYMLIDYIEGPDLKTLSHIQPEMRFSLPVTIAILAPVVNAIEYLHQQNPPIIHRDIKPSNIIVPVVGGKIILVDFGIAKEYDSAKTTSSVRHGSPGYGSPEQYTAGTNTRTDIYGLGATLFTLLTGNIPTDALERMMHLINEQPDPLKPVHELVPSIPLHISMAIQRAMSINMAQRYATVREFWQAIQAVPGQKRISEALEEIAASPTSPEVSPRTELKSTQPLQEPEKQLPGSRSGSRFLLSILLVLLLIVGSVASFWVFNSIGSKPAIPSPVTSAPSPIFRSTPASTATLPRSFARLARSYYGTFEDLQANASSQMTLTQMRQNDDGRIAGYFSTTHMNGFYSGLIDTSRQINFTVANSKSGTLLYFTGSVQANGELLGTVCAIDQSRGCIPGDVNGWWSVKPGNPPR